MKLQKWLLIVAVVLLLTGGVISSGASGLTWQKIDSFLHLAPQSSPEQITIPGGTIKITNEENVVEDVVAKVSPSVVTVGIVQPTTNINNYFQGPFFDPFGQFPQQPQQLPAQKSEQDIGSGFIISADGLIVTNKHVVSDTQASYKVITNDNKSYDVTKIYRDPDNDLAILKINATGLKPVVMGDSNKIKVGQTAIAIGTALGQFRNTVTVGVVSGVGRGITAGSPYDTSTEKLSDVIQTDAAINPGNSGGPLLNSAGQVIGVNSAMAQQGQNIGFALPINIVRDAVKNFDATGQFNRPFIGIEYRMISQQLSILNDVPEGAYVASVVSGSPADKAGIQADDIITKINGQHLTDTNDLAHVVSGMKVGDRITVEIWRNGQTLTKSVTLGTQ